MSFLLLPDKAQYTIVDHLSAHDTMRLVMATSERAAKDLCAAMGHCLDDRLRRAKAPLVRRFYPAPPLPRALPLAALPLEPRLFVRQRARRW